MTDIAEIGFRADTGDLERASLTMNKLQASAQGLEARANSLSLAARKSGVEQARAATEVASATTARTRASFAQARASGTAAAADLKQARAAINTAAAQEAEARSTLKAARADETLRQTTLRTVAAQIRQTKATRDLNLAAAETGRTIAGTQVARDQLPNRFNTANIAAQFQDIGVTAALGMNPLTVALQQGTQISAILNSMESPLRGLAIAFRSVINPVSLMSIAFTALAVVGLQMVDWVTLGKNVLNGFAGLIESIGPSALIAATGLALIYSPAILGGIAAATKGVLSLSLAAVKAGASMAAAWIAAAGPVTLIIAAIATVSIAMIAFRERLADLIGIDVVGNIKDGVNSIIGFFVGGYRGILAAWSAMPGAFLAIAIGAANSVAGVFEDLINKIIGAFNRIPGIDLQFRADFGQLGEANAQANEAGSIIGREMAAAMDQDFIGGVGQTISRASSRIRNFASGLGSGDEQSAAATKQIDNYAKLVQGANERITSLRNEHAAIGLSAQAASRLKTEQDLLNEASQKGLVLSTEQRTEISKLATEISTLEEQIRATNALNEITASGEKRLAGLKQEEDALFLTAEAAARLKNENELLNQAVEKGLTLTPQQVSDLRELAGEITDTEQLIQKTNAAKEAARSTIGSFVSELRQGLEAGKGFWASFGDAALGVLDKITNALLNDSIGGLVDAVFSGRSQSSGQGLFGQIVGGIGDFFGGVNLFEKGGTFTNSVVDGATPFSFAGGLGVMGEAGPEAVVPLSRGSDGSLGINASGLGQNSLSNTVVYNVDARGAEIGVEERVMNALEQVRSEIPQTAISAVRDESNRNLGAFA